MLVLGREEGEKIKITIPAGTVIDRDVEILVVLVEIRQSDKARIGIDAPRWVQVLRQEVADRGKEPTCP
jgi:carbon storage regulator CsrA